MIFFVIFFTLIILNNEEKVILLFDNHVYGLPGASFPASSHEILAKDKAGRESLNESLGKPLDKTMK